MQDNGYGYFKSSLRGFDKGDVIKFIERVNSEFNKEKERLQSKIDEQEKLSAELIAELEIAEKNAETRAAETEAAKAELSGLRNRAAESAALATVYEGALSVRDAKIAELETRLKDSEAAIIALQNAPSPPAGEEFESLRGMINELSGALAASESERLRLADEIKKTPPPEEPENKQEVYDRTMSGLGRMILSAEETAEKIIETAKAEAAEITRLAGEVKAEAKRLGDEAAEGRRRVYYNIRDELARFAASFGEMCGGYEKSIGDALRSFQDEFGKYFDIDI